MNWHQGNLLETERMNALISGLGSIGSTLYLALPLANNPINLGDVQDFNILF